MKTPYLLLCALGLSLLRGWMARAEEEEPPKDNTPPDIGLRHMRGG